MNTPSSKYTGLLVRFLRYFTRQIAHPITAWFLFLMLVSSNLAYGWVIENYLSLNSQALIQQARIDRKILDTQDELLKELRKVPQDFSNCQ